MSLDINQPFTSLHGTTAVVTGAGGGIGHAVTLLLASAGVVVVAADRNAESLDVYGGQDFANATVLPVAADVATREGMAEIERVAAGRGAPVSLWLNNAGIVSRDSIADMTPEQWDEIMAVNLRSVFLGCQAAHRLMKPRSRGSIVNIASMSASKVQKYRTAYAASKAAVMNTTRNLAVEWGGDGIRVNAIAPGFVLTPMSNWHILDETGRDELTSTIPLGRLADPRAIANMVLMLASPLTDYVTGEVVHVDGGWSL